jgi:hypothetical protein
MNFELVTNYKPRGETTLLVGQNAPAYFLVPVLSDVNKQD